MDKRDEKEEIIDRDDTIVVPNFTYTTVVIPL